LRQPSDDITRKDGIDHLLSPGRSTWGWYSYDPELNLVYYGSAEPLPCRGENAVSAFFIAWKQAMDQPNQWVN
jgi:hypothetical protein